MGTALFARADRDGDLPDRLRGRVLGMGLPPALCFGFEVWCPGFWMPAHGFCRSHPQFPEVIPGLDAFLGDIVALLERPDLISALLAFHAPSGRADRSRDRSEGLWAEGVEPRLGIQMFVGAVRRRVCPDPAGEPSHSRWVVLELVGPL